MKKSDIIKLFAVFMLFSLSIEISLGQPNNAAFRNLTSAEGLPSTSVADVEQDATGLIWIATWDGVYRFDGNRYERITDLDCRRLEADAKGGVWLSFSSFGKVGYFDTKTDQLRIYTLPNENRSPQIRIDEEGQVWTAIETGIALLDVEADTFLLDKTKIPYSASYLYARGKGHLDFITRDTITGEFGLARRYSDGNYAFEKLPLDKNNPVPGKSFIEEFPPFGIVAYGKTGLIIINKFGWAIRENAEDDWIFKRPANIDLIADFRATSIDKNGNLWISQENALSKIELSTRMVTTYKHSAEDPGSILPLERLGTGSSILIDRQGVLWTSRYGHGISSLNLYASDFGLLKDENGKPYPDVLSALEMEDGSFFVGTRTTPTGLYHINSEGNIIKDYGSLSFKAPVGRTVSTQMSHPFTWALAKTKDGSVWAGTGWPNKGDGGLNRIRPGNDEIIRYKNDTLDPNSLPDDWIRQLLVDKADRLWVRTLRKGWCWMDIENETFTPILHDDTPNPSDGFFWDSQGFINLEGNLVIGYRGEFMEVNQKTLEINPFISLQDTTDKIKPQFQDDQKRIWFTAKKGFGYLEAPFDKIAWFFDIEKNNFPSDEISTLNLDKKGYVWLATSNGIFRFNMESREWIHFGYDRGLQDNYFTGRTNLTGPSGKLYFSGTGGLNIIDPELIRINPYPPDMVFTRLRLDEKTILPGPGSPLDQSIEMAKKITVGPEVSVISFDFAAIHFAGINANRYQYKMEGFDNEWRDGGTSGNATYTNLSNGNYRFLIRGSNWDNVWSDGKSFIDIHILPPWWKTWWAYAIYSLILFLIGLWLYGYLKKRTIRKERQRAEQRELEQAREIEKAYTSLKETQSQLIHAEKMASLGELTAGIAHEIQNPLNFVNNFSDVSVDLLEELKEEAEAGNTAEVSNILEDLKQNLEKIHHHGARASGIVKGMLEHSRSGSGEKNPADINMLADEYLRLAYHGLRAKDKSFNADFKLSADENLPMINIQGQEIGRVLLNLINNAFYAVANKAKTEPGDYRPYVRLITKKIDNTVEITVQDNGKGIPDDILEKIFQPFFTTKPAGEGTGLGLSLSYDIITKGHGGDLKVKTAIGEGAEFIITLPLN